MKTRTRRKKKTRIGSSLVLLALWLAPAICADKKKAGEAQPYGQIGVTVFREPGFALPGAEVTLTANPETSADPQKLKKLQGTVDARGEVVFRVPVSAMRYLIRAQSKGFIPQEKAILMEGERRSDATFLLAPESK